MTLDELIDIITRMPGRRPITLTPAQRSVLDVTSGPLWVIAGPGSGKTETVILRCLRLMYVDHVNPRSIFLSTFTEKAARELQDRLSAYGAWVSSQAPSESEGIDISHVRVGTLHSLCNDIMHEFRYSGYQNYRLMDELEQLIFINEHSDLVRRRQNAEDTQLWVTFGGLLGGFPNIPAGSRAQSRLCRAYAFRSVVGRIVEYRLDLQEMERAGSIWRILAEGYHDYVNQLEATYRSDFSHVQSKFLEFLDTPRGALFLNGDGTSDNPGIIHILVDEYQDTNPIQEAIYIRMAQTAPHNLMVVGDDDQAIYRFRGGTIECLIGFEEACHSAWGDETTVQYRTLLQNHRSHERIVRWCNRFIGSIPDMQRPGARTPRPSELEPASDITARYGDYPAVSLITGSDHNTLARHLANTVRGMLDNNIITDPSDCALLMRSTRETRPWARHYVTALRALGIDVYNPRGRTFLEQQEVQTALGALLAVLDPQLAAAPHQDRIRTLANTWIAAFSQNRSPDLDVYVTRARSDIAAKPAAERFRISVAELFYILLSFEPFTTWQQDITTSTRLAKLTRLLETYTSMPWPDDPTRTRGWLSTSRSSPGVASYSWRQSFYWGLVSILEHEGLNDEEDEYELFPRGRLPIMTIFQAKGLQFPFVFVAGVGNEDGAPSGTHQAETILHQFRQGQPNLPFTEIERAVQDVTRLYYVAYSRAQYGLFILARYSDEDSGVLPLGVGGRQWLSTLGIRSLSENRQGAH